MGADVVRWLKWAVTGSRTDMVLEEKHKVRMAMDIARGMNYLHSCRPPVIHRDLKSPNLLVDKDFTVKARLFACSGDDCVAPSHEYCL